MLAEFTNHTTIILSLHSLRKKNRPPLENFILNELVNGKTTRDHNTHFGQ
jgi:hypothetical protein